MRVSSVGYSNSNNPSLQLWWTEKISLNTKRNVDPEVDRLQKHKTPSGPTPVSQDQEFEAAVGVGLVKLASWKLEKSCLVQVKCSY